MISFNSRCRAALLALTLLTTGQGFAFSFSDISSPITPKQFGLLVVGWTWIQVRAASTKNDYKLSDWKDDLEKFMKEFNVFEVYKKWIVGRRLSVEDKKILVRGEDGSCCEQLSDKYVKSTPFGAMGLFDAYIVQNIEKIAKILADYEKVANFFDSVGKSSVTVNTSVTVIK